MRSMRARWSIASAVRTLALLTSSATLAASSEAPVVASCELLEQAQSFAARLLDTPFHRRRLALTSVSAALQLRQLCNVTEYSRSPLDAPALDTPFEQPAATACEFWVAVNGSDDASGTTVEEPFATLGRARLAVLLVSSRPCIIWLRGGRHQLREPLRLGAEDSNTTYRSWQSETVVVSGGQLLTPTTRWKPAPAHPSGVQVVRLPKETKPFSTLFHRGKRQIRARFPNIHSPETDLFPRGYARCAAGKGIDEWGGTDWAIIGGGKPGLTLHVNSPNRSGTHFTNWQQRVGGPAELWSPAKCYDDAGQDYSLKQHEGLYYNTTMLRPDQVRSWTDVEDTQVHSMHPEFWSNYGWKLRNATPDSLHFREGGWQDQAGPTLGRQNLCSFFVENQLAECDSAGEWYYRAADHSLFFYPNRSSATSSSPPPPSLQFISDDRGADLIGGTLDNLVSIVATQSQPAVGIAFQGLTFAHTGVTFLKPYFIPGPGDWSLHDNAAVRMEGVVSVSITQCVFEDLGGNALMFAGYAQDCKVCDNEFARIGDSAVVAYGRANGIDLTDGNYPQDNLIEQNHIHTIGIVGKQVAGYFQSIAGHNTIRKNVIYNGPRVGINLNDGAIGGNQILSNLLFGLVRETNDHGPINSWDRQPFVSLRGLDGPTPSVTQATTSIAHNLIIANLGGSSGNGSTGSIYCICHDDGSSHFYDHHNVCVGFGLKNFLGHSQTFADNLIVRPDVLGTNTPGGSNTCLYQVPMWQTSGVLPIAGEPIALRELYHNNTCLLATTTDPYQANCNWKPNNLNQTFGNSSANTFIVPRANEVGFCGATLAQIQTVGREIGSVIMPSSDISEAEVAEHARRLLEAGLQAPEEYLLRPRNTFSVK